MAEMVVRSIINRRNTYRAQRRVVEDRGDCQLAQVLVEHRTPTLRGQAAVTGHGHPQHQRIAGDRQIGQRPGHGVAVAALGARSPGTADRGSPDVQKIVVGFSSTAASVIVTPNSMVRMIVSATTDGGQAVAFRQGSPRWCGGASVGTRIGPCGCGRARWRGISHGCWLGWFCAAASSPVFGSAARQIAGGRTGRHAPRRGPPHEFPTTCRVRSPRTGTPLRPPMSCEYSATAYATPPPLMPSAVRSMCCSVSDGLW